MWDLSLKKQNLGLGKPLYGEKSARYIFFEGQNNNFVTVKTPIFFKCMKIRQEVAHIFGRLWHDSNLIPIMKTTRQIQMTHLFYKNVQKAWKWYFLIKYFYECKPYAKTGNYLNFQKIFTNIFFTLKVGKKCVSFMHTCRCYQGLKVVTSVWGAE